MISFKPSAQSKTDCWLGAAYIRGAFPLINPEISGGMSISLAEGVWQGLRKEGRF